MKNKRKWLYIALAAALLVAAVAGGVFAASRNREPVFVYSFAEGIVGMTDYYDYSGESSGMVTTDRVQNVFLSSTQTVLEMLVTEGQEVKKGDILFTYDTTLSDIALMQKDLAVQQAKLDLETAQKELRVINSYVPIRYYEVEEPEPTDPPEPVANLADFDLEGKTYLVYSGSGSTSLTPKYCWLKSGTVIDKTLMQEFFADVADNVVFLRFQHTQEDKADGEIRKEYGVKLMRLTATGEDGASVTEYRFAFFDLVVPNSGPVDPGVEWNSGFTAAEIASMRAAKQAEIKDMEFKIKMEEAEFRIMQKEADSGEVIAEFDGTVIGVLCALGMGLLGLPYAGMIGALVSFTALIPVAGAYIGAAVGAFMILTVNPVQALVFLVFLVVLQQLEGNLIYPRVVGSSMGLPGIWVLAAVTVGGGVMGIGGMLLGVPLAAAAYRLIGEDIRRADPQQISEEAHES